MVLWYGTPSTVYRVDSPPKIRYGSIIGSTFSMSTLPIGVPYLLFHSHACLRPPLYFIHRRHKQVVPVSTKGGSIRYSGSAEKIKREEMGCLAQGM